MPNRILKESVCLSEQVDSLTWFEEVVFYRLIVNCDDYGRFDGRIPVIKSRLFALKENLTHKQISDAIGKLASIGLVVLYEFEGRPFLYLPTWNEHQSVRAKKSKYPAPLDEERQNNNICNQMHANDFTCSRNPIQSESNPIRETDAEAHACEGTTAAAKTSLGELVEFYAQNINPEVGPLTVDKMADWLKEVDGSLIRYAIEQAVDHEKRTWAYINTIIQSHFASGRKTKEAAQRASKNRQTQTAKQPKTGSTQKYDFEAMERKAREALNGIEAKDG